MTVATPVRYTKAQKARAERLWSELHGVLVDAEKRIVTIIKGGPVTWEALGYESFEDAWNDRMSDVRLASGLARAKVVYQLLSENVSDARIIELVRGTSDTYVANARRQKKAGVPAELLVGVSAHDRRRPSAPHVLHIEFTADEVARFRRIATKRGLDLDDEIRRLIRQRFDRLDK